MSYSDYFSVNKNFQSSINLELDLENEEKISEYIPTTDICDVLKKYIETVLGKSKDKATTLIGPYGKGKSFLLLVLTYILGKNKKSKQWNDLAEKIKNIDSELYTYLMEIREKDINLLPVIINSNYENLTQSFQIALNDALKQHDLETLVPNSVFKICLDMLSKWETNPDALQQIETNCKKINIDRTALRQGLKEYSQKAYDSFVALYNCVNIGFEFNPLLSNDIVKTYRDVSDKLSDYGYSGIFIIFDEFSKFLESNSSSVMKDLKLIQDFAELATRSGKNSQIHLCCIAHKSINLYSDSKSSKQYSASNFKTVEGRFKEIRFNRSIDENYQLIASAIKKTGEGETIADSFIQSNDKFYQSIKELDLFRDESMENTLFKGCFPLNPLTVYCLIQISEYSAQNERTLFTFLSDTDDDSFNSFIHNQSNGLFNVDKIYDYFSPMLKTESSNDIRSIWYRAQSCLDKIEGEKEKQVIKVIAVLTMIDNPEKLPVNTQNIALCLNENEADVSRIVNELTDAHYLRRNILNNSISFASSQSKEIENALAITYQKLSSGFDYGEIASEVNARKYVLPRKYNEINKITRFFNIVFLTIEKFMDVASFDYYFEQNYCDGLIVCLLIDRQIDKKAIDKKVESLKDKRIIVKASKEPIDKSFYEVLSKYRCLCEINKDTAFDEVTHGEIGLMLNESKYDARQLISEKFDESFDFYSCVKHDRDVSFKKFLSQVMDEIYPVALVFNNELINKRTVTVQYQKPINNVIEFLLNNETEFKYSATSAEGSIKVSILDKNEQDAHFRNVVEGIKNKISNSSGEKLAVTDIVKEYALPPYGIRSGVIPIIVAKAISELTDNIVLYYDSKEVALNAGNLVKAVANDKYRLFFSKSSKAQHEYMDNMMSLFGVASSNNFRLDTVNLTNSIKRFFTGLPQMVRLSKVSNCLGLDAEFIAYKQLFLTFNINPFESLFEKPKQIFNTENYEYIFEKISVYYTQKDNYLDGYKKSLIGQVKAVFCIDESSSLRAGFKEFVLNNVKASENPILEEDEKRIWNLIEDGLTYSDFDAIDQISKVTVGQYVEDWEKDKSTQLIDKLSAFKDSLLDSKKISFSSLDTSALESVSPMPLTGMAPLLKNSISSTLDEFSDSLTTSEKISVLTELIKELVK